MAKRIFEKEGCRYEHYDELKEWNYVGYAHNYIHQKWDSSSLENKTRLDVYKCLYRIDEKLGTKTEIQLYWCCFYAVNIDIIEVLISHLKYLILLLLSSSIILKSSTMISVLLDTLNFILNKTGIHHPSRIKQN